MAFIASTPLRTPSTSISSSSAISFRKLVVRTQRVRRAAMTCSAVTEKGSGMRMVQAADEATIKKLGCRTWSTWGCEPSTFPWTYRDDEVCLVLEGDFTVIPDDGSESMHVTAGDIAYFPRGMSCTWEVRKAVNKHFTFGKKL